MATHPRLIGAGLGALVGVLVVVAGVALSALLNDQAGVSTNLASFAVIGAIMMGVALPAGAVCAPWALRERRRTIAAGAAIAFLLAAGTTLVLVGYALSQGSNISSVTDSSGAPILACVVLGIAAAVAWVVLLRAITKGPRQSVPTFVDAAALLAATILVESLLLPR